MASRRAAKRAAETSTRAAKRRRDLAAAVERATQQRLTDIGTGWWARLNRQRAGDEQALLRRQIETYAEFDHASYAGTPETHGHASRTRQGSLARLHIAGDIDNDQLAYGVAIAAMYERICRGVGIRVVSLETRVDTSKRQDGAFFESLGQVRAEWAYNRWRAALPVPGPVLDMIIDDAGVSVAARRHGMANRRAKALLLDALDLWGEMISAACDEVDEATLLAAQAGIL